MTFTLWDIVRNLLLALRWTVVLTLVTFLLGGLLGALILLLRTSRGKFTRKATALYIELFQGTPLLMQLFLVYFGLSLLGLEVPAWLAATLGLALWCAAYLAEIWRGCVEAVARGQWEASASLAMGYLQQMRYIILPQAIRIAVVPTVGFGVQVVKATAVTSIIGFMELTKTATVITNATFQPFLVYSLVGLGYFMLCWPLARYSRYLERKLNAAYRN